MKKHTLWFSLAATLLLGACSKDNEPIVENPPVVTDNDWISPDGMQVTAAFEEYARPLILDEVTPVYVNGTPRHIRL